MDNLGYIKLHRKLFDSKIFLEKPSDWLKIWLFILGSVNFCDNGVQAGSKFLKYDYIVHECRVTYKQVEKCVSWLKKEGMINIKRLPNGGIIEVAKWSDYQDDNDIVKGNQKGIKRESKGNAINKNERMKEGKNEIYTMYESFQTYKIENPETVTTKVLTRFFEIGYMPAEKETIETFKEWLINASKESGKTADMIEKESFKWMTHYEQNRPKNHKSSFLNWITREFVGTKSK